jgi:hypothetical protein
MRVGLVFRWLLYLAVLTSSVVGMPQRALAQDDAAKEKAKELFAKGKADYDAGRYPEALVSFEAAYATKPVPPMLKIIAQTHEAMENLPLAVEFFTRYLESGPKDADKITEKLAELRKTIAGNWGTIELSSEPSGAEVWLGKKAGPPRGKTPFTLQLPAGQQTLVLEKAGFQPVQRVMKVAPGRTVSLGIALPTIMPVLTVRTTPVGADVLIDGAPVGRTPFTQAFPGGPHRLELRLGGHAPHVQEVELAAAHTASTPMLVEVTLQPQTGAGLLALQVDRPGSQVLVNDKEVGRTPLAEPLSLPEGLHKLVVRADGVRPHEEMVAINAGQTTVTRIELGGVLESGTRGGGLSGRTWGWILMGTGAAALAASGVFGVLALSADGDLQDCRDDPACVRTQSEVDKADAVRSKALLTDISLGAGLAIAGAGLTVFLLSDPPGNSTGVSVLPLPGGAAATGRWEF